jgi:hypothetical protein
MYRVLVNLSKDDRIIYKGSIITGRGFQQETIERLIDLGKIARVSSPPLNELNGWKSRAKKLAMAGIITIDQFIEVDSGELARILNKPPFIIDKWKHELERLLEAPKPEQG